jgi:hypothetical protein
LRETEQIGGEAEANPEIRSINGIDSASLHLFLNAPPARNKRQTRNDRTTLLNPEGLLKYPNI